jgi:NADH-quinone oxidoreductase subunit N
MQSSSSLAPVAPIIFWRSPCGDQLDRPARGKARTSVAYPLSLLTTLVLRCGSP